MNKKCFLILFLFAISKIATAQLDTAYIYAYGGINDDYARQIISTSDSGFIVVGSTSSFGSGSSDVYVIKTDSNCNKQWSQVYGTSSVEWGYLIRQTFDSGYIIAGFTNQQIANGYDIYLIKINSSGVLQWTKTIGGTDWDFGYALELTADSGFIICGKSYSYSNGGSDAYIVKTDSLGNVVWQKNYGGTNDEAANAIIRDRDFNFLIVGETNSYGAGDDDFYILKINGNGDTLWTKTLGTPKFDAGYGVDTALDGNYLIIGTTYGDPTDTTSSQIMFMKIDTSGNLIWTQMAGGINDEEGWIIKQLPSGEIFTGGMTQSFGHAGRNFLVYRDDSNGNYIAGAGFGENEDDEGYSVALGKDIRMVGAGITKSYGCGFNDIYLIRFPSYAIENEYDLSLNQLCDNLINVSEIPGNNTLGLSVYPNPTNDYFTINYDGKKQISYNNYTLKIFDITGRVVETFERTTLPITLKKKENISEGIYLIKLFENDKPCGFDKLIIY